MSEVRRCIHGRTERQRCRACNEMDIARAALTDAPESGTEGTATIDISNLPRKKPSGWSTPRESGTEGERAAPDLGDGA